MFDKIYVLSRLGLCLYYGQPNSLNDFFRVCGIDCQTNERPIEALLKFSSIGGEDKAIDKMVRKTNHRINEVIRQNSCDRSVSKQYTVRRKRFKVKDIYYLLMRRIEINFFDKKKSLLIETVFHLLFVWIITNAVDDNVSKVDGCFTTSSNSSNCMDKEKEKLIIEQNIYLLYITSFVFMLTTISITTKNLMQDIDIFLIELKNSKQSIVNDWSHSSSSSP